MFGEFGREIAGERVRPHSSGLLLCGYCSNPASSPVSLSCTPDVPNEKEKGPYNGDSGRRHALAEPL